jgi:uncharacterized protein (TIGR03067 family)
VSGRSLIWAALLAVAIVGFLLYCFLAPYFRTTVKTSENVVKSEERNNLKGSWRLLRVEGPGVVVRPNKGEEIIYEFEEGKLSVRRSEGNEVQTAENTYQLDDTKDPKTIDMTMTFFVTATVNGKTQSSKQEKKVHGIYDVEADNLRLCLTYLDQERPTKFVPPAKATGFLLVCERLK